MTLKNSKKNQKQRLENYNEQQLNNTETINYADDLNLDDLLEKKNSKIAAKQISDKYEKLRKRKATISVPKLHKISETLIPSNKKGKKTTDKRLIEAAKKIRNKCKNLYGKRL